MFQIKISIIKIFNCEHFKLIDLKPLAVLGPGLISELIILIFEQYLSTVCLSLLQNELDSNMPNFVYSNASLKICFLEFSSNPNGKSTD